MKCTRTCFRSIVCVGACTMAVLLANECWAVGYRAGKSEGSVTLGRDSNSGSSSRVAPVRPQPPAVNRYPGALRKQPPGTSPTQNWRPNSGRATPNWGLGGERWRPMNPGNDGINGAAGLGKRNIARIETRLRELYQQRQMARTKYEHGGGYPRDLNDYRVLDRRIRELENMRLALLRSR